MSSRSSPRGTGDGSIPEASGTSGLRALAIVDVGHKVTSLARVGYRLRHPVTRPSLEPWRGHELKSSHGRKSLAKAPRREGRAASRRPLLRHGVARLDGSQVRAPRSDMARRYRVPHRAHGLPPRQGRRDTAEPRLVAPASLTDRGDRASSPTPPRVAADAPSSTLGSSRRAAKSPSPSRSGWASPACSDVRVVQQDPDLLRAAACDRKLSRPS